MKCTISATIDIQNDWDSMSWLSPDSPQRRKAIIEDRLKQAMAASLFANLAQLGAQNSITIMGMSISEPEWEGWDNARLAKEMADG